MPAAWPQAYHTALCCPSCLLVHLFFMLCMCVHACVVVMVVLLVVVVVVVVVVHFKRISLLFLGDVLLT